MASRLSRNRSDPIRAGGAPRSAASAAALSPAPAPIASTTGPVACPHFGDCGGCSFLDVEYGEELRRKEDSLRLLLAQRPALADVPVLPILPARSPLFGRTSLKVPFTAGPRVGFFARGSHRVVDLRTCVVQDPRLTALVQSARELCRELRVPVYDEWRHHGVLRHLVARVAAGTGEVLAGLVVQRSGTRFIEWLAKGLLQRHREHGLVGVAELLNRERGNRILGQSSRRLAGRDFLEEHSDGLSWRTTLLSFAQTNVAQACVLFQEVGGLLEPLEGRRVLDVFAGNGAIALRLARAGATVTAIERNPAATREGRAAARRNGLSERVEFFTGDALHGLSVHARATPDAVVLDPARRGLGEQLLRALVQARVPRVVYVSCNPGTLVRDLEGLAAAYRIRGIRPMDMFPRVDHLETVADLECRGEGPGEERGE